jgi:hypothetical protein
MNKENLNNSEIKNDMFPEVTNKYLKLWETYDSFCNEVSFDLFPMVKSVDDSLIDIYKIVAKDQKLLDKNCAYVEGYCWWNWAGRPRNYLYWGDKENGLELVQIASHHEKNFFPESDDFMGFDKVKSWVGVNRGPLRGEVNIPSSWQEIKPVLYRYDWVTNDSFEKIKNIESVDEACDKYWKAKEYTEMSMMKMVEDEVPEMREKILDLNRVILEIPQIKDQIPEYLAADQGDLRWNVGKNEDIFFLPKSGQLVRAPVELIGPLRKVGKEPILEKAYEAELADWVRIGLTMKWKMIKPVEKIGWVKPKYI